MQKLLPALALSVFVAACAPLTDPGASGAPSAGNASLRTYENDAVGYAIEIPSDWTITENDAFVGPTYETAGTTFAYPAERDGSALGEAAINVATLPECPAQDGGTMDELNGQPFLRTDFSDAAAGSRYRGQTFAIERDGSCLVVTLRVRWCGLGVDCGPDRQAPFSYDDALSTLRRSAGTLRLR